MTDTSWDFLQDARDAALCECGHGEGWHYLDDGGCMAVDCWCGAFAPEETTQ